LRLKLKRNKLAQVGENEWVPGNPTIDVAQGVKKDERRWTAEELWTAAYAE
jgi:hypothetical protein